MLRAVRAVRALIVARQEYTVGEVVGWVMFGGAVTHLSTGDLGYAAAAFAVAVAWWTLAPKTP